jgi:site-specific DNA-cytosine methylase
MFLVTMVFISLIQNSMNILSLFDGISCGRLALERAGIKVDKYFASEIDKYAIQIAKKNFPDTIHIGSVTDIEYDDDT